MGCENVNWNRWFSLTFSHNLHSDKGNLENRYILYGWHQHKIILSHSQYSIVCIVSKTRFKANNLWSTNGDTIQKYWIVLFSHFFTSVKFWNNIHRNVFFFNQVFLVAMIHRRNHAIHFLRKNWMLWSERSYRLIFSFVIYFQRDEKAFRVCASVFEWVYFWSMLQKCLDMQGDSWALSSLILLFDIH